MSPLRNSSLKSDDYGYGDSDDSSDGDSDDSSDGDSESRSVDDGDDGDTNSHTRHTLNWRSSFPQMMIVL